MPTGAVTGPVTVTTPIGTGTSTTPFVVYQMPTIQGFTPAVGPVGTSVTITGSGFQGTSSVKFGTIAASFVVQSDTRITTTTPTGTTAARLWVTTPGGSASSAAT